MNIDYKLIKTYLKHVYFINGTAYAGKSTVCKALAKKYDMHLCEENYLFDKFLNMTTPESHPNMNYFKTMDNWEEFIFRSKEAYEMWLDGVARETAEFEILELLSLPKHKKIIVDTNIPDDILKQISDEKHVIYMVATQKIAMEEFFNRNDFEKQFIFNVIQHTSNPIKSMKHYKETIAYINREERINRFKRSGFPVIERKEIHEDIQEKILKAEEIFGLTNEIK